jgi:hypothetical protein
VDLSGRPETVPRAPTAGAGSASILLACFSRPGENYFNGGRLIMATFTERYDFSGKTVHPITTYAMSGLGATAEDYAQLCRGACIGTGLAVRGEEVQSNGARAVAAWLRRTGVAEDRRRAGPRRKRQCTPSSPRA